MRPRATSPGKVPDTFSLTDTFSCLTPFLAFRPERFLTPFLAQAGVVAIEIGDINTKNIEKDWRSAVTMGLIFGLAEAKLVPFLLGKARAFFT
jgi:hypothetical protein